MIAESCAPSLRGRAFGFHRAMDHLGAAIGSLIATAFLWMWPDQIRTLFLLTLIPGLMVVGLVIFGLKEITVTPRTDDVEGIAVKQPVRLTLASFDGNFRLFLFALLVFSLGNSSDVFLLVRAEELGVPRLLIPVLWCLFHILKSTSNLWCGAAVDRYGPKPFILAGWFFYAVIYLCFALATNTWHIWAIFLCYALFYGLTEPAEKTLVAALAGPERKGLAFGWFNFTIGVSTLPASVLFGALYQDFGPLTAFGVGAALALVASLLVSLVRIPPHPHQP